MRPLMVINGILLGSCLSIAVSLLLVLIVFLIIGDDYPRIRDEFGSLSASLAIFFVMTIVSAGSFYALAIRHPSRIWLQCALWAGVFLTGYYYWP